MPTGSCLNETFVGYVQSIWIQKMKKTYISALRYVSKTSYIIADLHLMIHVTEEGVCRMNG